MSPLSDSIVDYISSLSKPGLYLAISCLVVLCYLVGSTIHSVFFHPLRQYPGPKLWAASRLPYSLAYLSGDGHKKILDLHRKYGEIVRVGPDSLSFCYPNAWEDIFGHRARGQLENGKDQVFWKDHKFSVIAGNRDNHARLRRVLSHGFSAQSMMAQQPLIQNYVSLLMERLKSHTKAGESVEMTSWLNWTTFDVIGDLTFGAPFGCLEKSYYHPWIALFFDHIKGTAILSVARRFPFGESLLKLMMTKKQEENYRAHLTFTQESVNKRLAMKEERPDFMEEMVKAHDDKRISYEEIMASAVTLIAGGSETTGTTLAGAVYLLATHKDVFNKLAREVRTRFRSEGEIDMLNVQGLEYMMAVIHEVLRVYPVVPASTPRRAPPEGNTTRDGHYIPPNTILEVWQYPMFYHPDHFRDSESFVPERWLGDPRFANDKRDAMQPFSTGPRNCLGKNLAYAELRLILARFIWNFDFELDARSENWIGRGKLYLLWEKPDLFVHLTEVHGRVPKEA